MVCIQRVLVLAISTLASATPLVIARDAGTTLLLNDLTRLDQSVRNATTVISNYMGGAASYEPIREAIAQINTTNRIAYDDAMTIDPQNVAASKQIIALVTDHIAPDIAASINATVAKKALIEAAGLASETADALNLLDYDHDTLSAAIAAKLAPSTLLAATPPVVQIDLNIRKGVVEFGGVPLAPLVM